MLIVLLGCLSRPDTAVGHCFTVVVGVGGVVVITCSNSHYWSAEEGSEYCSVGFVTRDDMSKDDLLQHCSDQEPGRRCTWPCALLGLTLRLLPSLTHLCMCRCVSVLVCRCAGVLCAGGYTVEPDHTLLLNIDLPTTH